MNRTNLERYEEHTDSDCDEDEKLSPGEMKKRPDQFEKMFKRNQELIKTVYAEILMVPLLDE
ncbi:hypothetical protein AMTR_s00203p00011990 [Amborella trichopoda]|uniref:Uncharacterized protein n=1 Tax=Amborella trichopoda TaxID=13333 RepID=W1P7Z6_AMBTC|nr:hypothetical protein AMTR_s00203p00011990 [Amborella trichopoda]